MQILWSGFRATSNVRNYKVALNPLHIIFLNFGSPSSFLRKLRVLLAGHIVAMVTCCVTNLTATCSPMTGQCFDTMSLASTDIRLGKFWKLFRATLSHPQKDTDREIRTNGNKLLFRIPKAYTFILCPNNYLFSLNDIRCVRPILKSSSPISFDFKIVPDMCSKT